jgi:hypothetical protein
MDSLSLMRDIDLVAASSGVTLNPEQRAAIRPSLEILKQEKGFSSVLLWGKLLGDAGEYVIAEGVGFPPEGKLERNKVAGSEPVLTEYFDSVKDIPRQFFRLGADAVSWVPLPAVTADIAAKVADFETDLRRSGTIFVPLSGNASNKFAYKVIIPPPPKKVKEPVVVAEGEEAPPPEPEEEEKGPEIIEKELAEDERLAHLIAQINFATAVVPRGAYILNSSRQVLKNPYPPPPPSCPTPLHNPPLPPALPQLLHRPRPRRSAGPQELHASAPARSQAVPARGCTRTA